MQKRTIFQNLFQKKIILSVSCTALIVFSVNAQQGTGFDIGTSIPSSYSSSNMSSSQETNIEQQARLRGYSEQQIQELKKRYHAQSSSSMEQTTYLSGSKKSNPYNDSLSFFSDSINLATYNSIDTITPDSMNCAVITRMLAKDTLPYFGYTLFKQTPEAFKPNSFGPIDPGYLAGPGDVLRLSVWGEVEFQYELTIDKEGKIFIPVAGQVYASGIPFSQLQKKIQNILSKHYSGLASKPQKSFMDLSIAEIRPIRIFIMGEVKTPGGYTVATSSTSFNAFYSIGGPLVSGTLRNIKVLRGQKEIAVLDMYQYLTTGKCSTDVRLLNDDILYVPRREKTITLFGSVFRPAIYELRENEHLQSLLGFCGGILPGSNITHARIRRVKPFDKRTNDNPTVELIGLDLKKYINGKIDFDLFDRDTLEIIPLSSDLKNYATINGAVHYPGVYQCDSLSLHKLIFSLGKPMQTYSRRADLIRRNPDMTTTNTIPINLDALFNDSAKTDCMLQPFDNIIVYEKEVEKPTDLLITVDGEVRKPGICSLSTNMTVTDAILHAGGFTREAYKKAVDLYRIKLTKHGSDTLFDVFKISLPDSLTYIRSSERFFQLKDRDKIIIRPDPDYIVDNYINIDGLIKFRGNYALYQRGERLSDIIQRAGGLLPDAFLDGATVTRNGERLVVNFTEALTGRSSKENILLQKNDSIFIPSCPNTVLINGNVNNPGLFSYVHNSKLKTYIDRAGGLADSTSFILLTSPGGETQKIGRVSFKNPVVLEGSEIMVMRKLPKNKSGDKQGPTITEVVRDTLAILASAVTVIGLVIQFKD